MSGIKYKVLDSLKAKTKQGEVELQAGQLITLPHNKAIKLIKEGKITPIEKVAYKIFSESLQAFFWIVQTDHDMHSLRSKGNTEAIYNGDEIKKLKGTDSATLKEIHKIKEVFELSQVTEVKKRNDIK